MSVARLFPALALLAGCTAREAGPPPVAYAPAAIAPAAPAPVAGYANLAVPARLGDGGYATPNRMVASSAGAIWHLRAGLNVAALACRGADEAAIIAGYNALLIAHRGEFATAYRAFGAEHGSVAAFDGAMTKLYNYYASPPAQFGLCQAALAVLTDTQALPAGGLAAFAPGALARLDAPYVAIFAQQDLWRASRFAARTPVTALRAQAAPRLSVDPGVFANP